MTTSDTVWNGLRTKRGDLAAYARWEYGTREAAAWILASLRR